MAIGNICYHQPTTTTVTLAAILIVGTFISYVAQWVVIIRNKSSEGLNWMSLATSLFTGLLTLINAGILNWERLICCQVQPGHPRPGQKRRERLQEYWWALVGFAATLVTSIFVCGICFVLFYGGFITGHTAYLYGQVVGTVSAVLTFFIWAPQIYTTWKLGEAGALSLPMLLLQAPGAFVAVICQLIQTPPADWSTWAPYGVAGSEQIVLICLLVYYWWRDRKKANLAEDKDLLKDLLTTEGETDWEENNGSQSL